MANIEIICIFLVFLINDALSQYETIYIGTNQPDTSNDQTRHEIINNFLNNKPLLNYVPVYNTNYGLWEGVKPQEDTNKRLEFIFQPQQSPQLISQPQQTQLSVCQPQTQSVLIQPPQAQSAFFQQQPSQQFTYVLPPSQQIVSLPQYAEQINQPQLTQKTICQSNTPASYPTVDLTKLDQVISRIKTDMQNLSQKTKSIYETKLKELNDTKKLNDNLKIIITNADSLKNTLNQKTAQTLNGVAAINPMKMEQFLKTVEGLESMVRNINDKCGAKT